MLPGVRSMIAELSRGCALPNRDACDLSYDGSVLAGTSLAAAVPLPSPSSFVGRADRGGLLRRGVSGVPVPAPPLLVAAAGAGTSSDRKRTESTPAAASTSRAAGNRSCGVVFMVTVPPWYMDAAG